MALWRFVEDVPFLRVRKNELKELPASYLKVMSKQAGRPWWMFAIPSDLGLHFSERTWPATIDVPVEPGRTLETEPVDPAAITKAEKALEEARQAQAQAGEGLTECRARLEAIERKTQITGADHTEVSSWATNLHHEKNWSARFLAAAAEVGRLEVELAHLRQAQERAQRHQVDQDAGLEELKAELRRLALVVVQYPGAVELLDGQGLSDVILRYGYPPLACDAAQALRNKLLVYLLKSGRKGKTPAQMLQEPDVRALLEWAASQVEQARSSQSEMAEAPGELVEQAV